MKTPKGANNTYFGNLAEGIRSSWQGLKVSLKHFFEARRSRKPMGVAAPDYFAQQTGIVTLKYPYEALPVPDNGRYRLHNEMEDCIVCDKCAEICPVDCIEIEAVKSPEEIRKTSDGHSVRLYAAKFDIDMAKCCFCGLCTTVCPTECLTMTKTYDFSELVLDNLNYHFSDLSPDEAVTKRKAYEDFQAAKLAAKEAAKAEKSAPVTPPADALPPPGSIPADSPAPEPAAKPVVKRPVIKPVIKKPNPDQPNPDA
jgi:NADH-quinone oxidoreductase subunit I